MARFLTTRQQNQLFAFFSFVEKLNLKLQTQLMGILNRVNDVQFTCLATQGFYLILISAAYSTLLLAEQPPSA